MQKTPQMHLNSSRPVFKCPRAGKQGLGTRVWKTGFTDPGPENRVWVLLDYVHHQSVNYPHHLSIIRSFLAQGLLWNSGTDISRTCNMHCWECCQPKAACSIKSLLHAWIRDTLCFEQTLYGICFLHSMELCGQRTTLEYSSSEVYPGLACTYFCTFFRPDVKIWT